VLRKFVAVYETGQVTPLWARNKSHAEELARQYDGDALRAVVFLRQTFRDKGVLSATEIQQMNDELAASAAEAPSTTASPVPLTPIQKEALLFGIAHILQELLEDVAGPDDSSDFAADELPPQFGGHYTKAFMRRFLVSAISMSHKLTHPNPSGPSCVAEEMSLYLFIEAAKTGLEIFQDSGRQVTDRDLDFSSFEDVMFQDPDFEMLFDLSLDGIEDSEVGARLGAGNLSPDEWFHSFRNTEPAHPFVANPSVLFGDPIS
jgi:hypothetical protein